MTHLLNYIKITHVKLVHINLLIIYKYIYNKNKNTFHNYKYHSLKIIKYYIYFITKIIKNFKIKTLYTIINICKLKFSLLFVL